VKPSLLIVGLGNPGASYEKTRHNLGFLAVDKLAAEYGQGEWENRQKFVADTLEARIVTAPVLLVKPQIYMNRSGESVRKIIDFFKLDPATQLLIISDDIDLPVGDVRLRMKGGPGTHNGLKSLVEQFGEDFPRLRIGVGAQPAGSDLSNWVLGVPSAEDRSLLDHAIAKIPGMVNEFVHGKK
jgi:PTH1 family peptidyl-tRNA hydrolase